MKEQEKTGRDSFNNVIPKKYRTEFTELLNSHDTLASDIRKILFKMGDEESENFLTELKRWIDLGMQEVYYNEKYVKPRISYSKDLAEWDLECALAEHHKTSLKSSIK